MAAWIWVSWFDDKNSINLVHSENGVGVFGKKHPKKDGTGISTVSCVLNIPGHGNLTHYVDGKDFAEIVFSTEEEFWDFLKQCYGNIPVCDIREKK